MLSVTNKLLGISGVIRLVDVKSSLIFKYLSGCILTELKQNCPNSRAAKEIKNSIKSLNEVKLDKFLFKLNQLFKAQSDTLHETFHLDLLFSDCFLDYSTIHPTRVVLKPHSTLLL